MPLERIIEKSEKEKVAIWHLTESLDDLLQLINLSKKDQETLKEFRLDKRKQEWICSRILIQHLLGEYPQIEYTDNGKPFLSNQSNHISISHASGYVAVSISDFPTALDIEICSPRVEKAASRFVHTDEWLFITDEERVNFLTLIWSAKETLYKYFDEWGVVFKEHFRIKSFEISSKGQFKSHCKYKQHNKDLVLDYEITPNYALVYHLND
ncbi:4'-phosphopantetheinyl transferase family protein [Carboxylicivirga linearis]|uniref:4'-phosphopantetheinyl transferase superfamily protein n=1 Tax=Carboxylicivirga linearis TaxID=1628157 RepID=A0ABS5JQL9_9BACT|nr:4'-phosphopantetheinyl transferase superfamily protein [Carboxylicivirga linearis]MBS2097089.1 4'-phosphopantetheinyl transferase superfamily protein [Carboxylicivirga linearis]